MAISGAFAGLAGGHRRARLPLPLSASPTSRSPRSASSGIAVALLGRNTALGVALSALLFGALLFGTTHGLQSSEIDPGLASNLTYMIQGLIVLFVGGRRDHPLHLEQAPPPRRVAGRPDAGRGGEPHDGRHRLGDLGTGAPARRRGRSARSASCSAPSRASSRSRRSRRRRSSGRSRRARRDALRDLRGDARRAAPRLLRDRVRLRRDRPLVLALQSSSENLNAVFRADLIAVDARLLDAARRSPASAACSRSAAASSTSASRG